MVTIFEYLDYREYLKAYFADRKTWDSRFSHRWLAQRLSLSTSNFVLLVMQGKRNLTHDVCLRLSEVFKHTKKESEYFEEMVNFAQAKTDREKQLYFERLSAKRKNPAIKKMDEFQYEYYKDWYNPVIRELVCDPGFDGTPQWLARTLTPTITSSQATRSIELLLKLGMIERRGSRFVQCNPLVTTGPEVVSLAVRNFHRSMGRLAIESLERIPREQRSITCSTIKIAKKDYARIAARVEEFRKELLAFASPDEGSDRVYQLNFQIFPVTRELRTEGKQ